MRAKYSVRFNRKGKLNKEGKGVVQIEVRLNGERKFISTGVYLYPNEYVEKAGQYTPISVLNYAIIDKIRELQIFEERKRIIDGDFKLDDFDKIIEKEEKQIKKQITFIDFYEEQLKIEKNNLEYSVWKQQCTNLLFFKECCGNEVKFEDLNFALIQKFDTFLKRKGNKLSTVGKRHRQLKKYINLAIKHGHLDRNKYPYYDFKPQKSESNREYLNKEELRRIEELTFTPENRLLELSRDMFLFSCYTGLRYSDVHKLSKNNFNKSETGYNLRYTAEKTKKAQELPLQDLFDGKAEPLVKKYWREDDRRFFYGMTNQKSNLHIKEIAKLANISKYLTYHTSRHTFGTIAVQILPITVVQSILQHSDIKTTMVYLHLSNKERNETISKSKGKWK